MGIGPFTTYAPPGVYTQTIIEPVTSSLLGGLRIPVIIGTAQETLSQTDYELIRGSSSFADTPIFNEDVTGHWVIGGTPQNPILGAQDGSRFQFRVRNYPIVDGTGAGRTTFETTRVSVTVNGSTAAVSLVDGTDGIITLLIAPQPSDVVFISYFFHRGDTRITDDVSQQVTVGQAVLIANQTEPYNINAGLNDTLQLYVDDATNAISIAFAPGSITAAALANLINAAGVTDLTASVFVDNRGLNRVQLIASGNILVGSGNANGLFGFNPGMYTNRAKSFRVFNGPIVDGSGGGITTTDPSKVVVKVNNIQVLAKAVDGLNQTVTLAVAPNSGSQVTILYYFNTFQDTFDYLPNNNIVSVGNVGISPGRRDYLNGPDFIVVNQNDQSIIQWGTAFQTTAGQTTGLVPLNSVQIVGLLVDNKIYGAPCTRFTDPVTATVTTTKWVLPLRPTTGNGRDTPLGISLFQTITNGRIDLPTNRPDLVQAYVGKTFRDAVSRPAVVVTSVDSSTNIITLANPVPADYTVFATFYYNRIVDDAYTLSVVSAGPSGTGKYTVASQVQNAELFGAKFGTKTALPQIVQWPSGAEQNPDAFHYGGVPISETVTITFNNALDPATHASFSNGSPDPYDLYTASSIFGGIVVDGAAPISVDLSIAFQAVLVSQPVTNPLAFLATDHLVLEIDGITLAAVDLSAAASLATVATDINAVIDVDSQVHADGSSIFATPTMATLIALVNQEKTEYNLHLANNGGGYHGIPDVINPVTSPSATDFPSLLTLINELRTKYEAHRVLVGGGPVHGSADATNFIVAPLATDVASAIALANEFKLKYNAHIIDVAGIPAIHAAPDVANTVTLGPVVVISNNLVSTVTYGTQVLLIIKGRNVPSATNGLTSEVKVLIPVIGGQTDASLKIGLAPNEVANGSYNALNQSAIQIGTNVGPFVITTGVNDILNINVDATDYNVVLPGGSNILVANVVDAINSKYAQISNLVDYTAAIATVVALANDLKTKYNAHRTQAGVHVVNDTVNIVSSPAATDLPSALTLINEIQAKYNAHRTQATVHVVNDTVNIVSAAPATDLATAILLANQIKAEYEAHRVSVVFHTIADVVNFIVAANASITTLIAYAGLGINVGKVVITSLINTVNSNVQIKNTTTAATALGFTLGLQVFRDQPTAADVANALDNNAGFLAEAVAYAIKVPGLGNYLEINSLTTGTTSTISFTGAANSAFNIETGINITPGVSGNAGRNAQAGYTVVSSAGASGSNGTGIPGQTYTDPVTGLRFTILPAGSGDYVNAGSFTLLVDSTFTADASIPIKEIPGIEISVLNTINMGVGTTGIVTTYVHKGTEPAIGDVYYISYQYAKSSLSTQLFRDLKSIQQNFGPPTPDNPLSLGAQLALLNGAILVGLRQVLRAPNSGQASTQSYIDAINEQQKTLPGNIKPDTITCLATDPQIFTFLNQHCIFMSAIRQEGERIGTIGSAVGTTPLGAQAIAQSLSSERIIEVYPDSFVITVTDSQNNSVDTLVDGSFCAAALAGSTCTPSIDVATPITRRQILGFKQLGRLLDPTEANQTAVSGISVIESTSSGLRVRQGLTTNTSSVIVRTPSVVLTIDFVQQTMRRVLDPYIGQKFTGGILKTVENAMIGAFANLIDQQIVAAVAGIAAQVDPVDPTIMRAEAIYVPVFPLEYIVVTLQVRIRL